MKWESFVEQQIRDAQQAGAFDNLPGFGKPLHDLGDPSDDLWWVKRLLQREQLSALPPSLEIRLDVHKTMQRLRSLADESAVRRELLNLNERIDRANRSHWGPASTTMPVDVEALVDVWRAEWQPAQ